MSKADFIMLVNKLIALGEDKDELLYWVNVYDNLEPENQLQLNNIILSEMTELSRSSK